MAARQRKTSVGDDVSTESVETVSDALADVVPLDKVTMSQQGDMIEITYSRSWDLAVVQYEKMSIFTSIKRNVPVGSDLEVVGTEISDQLNEIQGADLSWARSMCTNRGSLVTKIIPSNNQ